MSVPNCLLTAGYINNTNDTFLTSSPDNTDFFYKGNILAHSFPTGAGKGLSTLSQSLVCVSNEKIFSHFSPSHKQKGL